MGLSANPERNIQMQDIINWVVALIVALGGIGFSLYFQGKLLLEPNKKGGLVNGYLA